MTGSDGETGRRPGATSDPFSDAAECFVCRRQRPAASCEQRQRIFKHLEKEQPLRNRWRTPRSAAVCKDCCIAALDGHRCPWWHLCWRG